ncbi:MAG: hypothetical protein JHC52_06350 [Chthoniobacterales bacterium]|nr:hypothetical protein [Chthoniobacterales bacterium]
MNLRPGLALLACLSLVSCVTTSPPAVEMPEANVLPLELSGDFSFRKTIRTINTKVFSQLETRAEVILFERNRMNYGALSDEERRQREGTYFDIFWRAERPADITVRFEYRQAKLGNAVRAKETIVAQAKGTVKSAFDVTGDDFITDGPVTAWRCLLIENGRIVGFTQSYLWK